MPIPDPNKLYTPAEYFAIEAVAEEKSNYLEGRIFRTMAATENAVQRNVVAIRENLQTSSVPGGAVYLHVSTVVSAASLRTYS